MKEYIDKRKLFDNLFVSNGKICPDTDIDNFPITIDVKEVKKAIFEQPTITEAEIRAKAIDEFVALFIEESNKRPYLRHIWIEQTDIIRMLEYNLEHANETLNVQYDNCFKLIKEEQIKTIEDTIKYLANGNTFIRRLNTDKLLTVEKMIEEVKRLKEEEN